MEQIRLNVRGGEVLPEIVPVGTQIIVDNYDGPFNETDPGVLTGPEGQFKRDVFISPADVPMSSNDQLELPLEYPAT